MRALALLQEVSEFLDPYVDVRDGSDGPLPNKAMSLKAEVDIEIAHIRGLAGPGLPVEIRLNDDKTLDEVCAPGAHLEQMDHNHWFLEIGAGKSVAVWLYSKGKITATYERRDYSESPATTLPVTKEK